MANDDMKDIVEGIDKLIQNIKENYCYGCGTQLSYCSCKYETIINKLTNIKTMKHEENNAFVLTEEQKEKIKAWNHPITGHKCTAEIRGDNKYWGCCGDGLEYKFIPTNLGTVIEVQCGCGAKLDITEDFM